MSSSPQCRTIVGDADWPHPAQWSSFNQSVDGKLVATVPIAAPCHRTLFNQANLSLYDEQQCADLRNTWFFSKTHLPSSSSPMAYQFTNNSCNPWLDADSPCTLGYLPNYTVNATSAEDIRKAVVFAKEYNIRLVIRNTGHDYLGKSTGAFSLAVWTHYMKNIELLPHYANDQYSGAAIKVGAGLEGIEANTFADAHGLMLVGGNCPSVGIAGGYSQGGGHGPLVSKFGLAVDQVLEWEVITAQAELLTASPASHPDLYWALSGGGGGTFGVVVSMTVKAHPTTYGSVATLTAANTGNNTDAFYEGIGHFLQELPKMVDAGAFVVWIATPEAFTILPAFAPGLHQDQLDDMFQPTREIFSTLGISLTYQSYEQPTFLELYNSLPDIWNVSDASLGGRLIPRSLLQTNPDGLVDAIRFIASQATMTGVSYNVANATAPDFNSANPHLRDTIFGIVLGEPVSYTDWEKTEEGQQRITNVLLPTLQELTPNGAAYLNEADVNSPLWREEFYGGNYERLDKIKNKYDPDDLFYAKTGVGSHRWEQGDDGRLCRT
ncbi:FAD binding domain protein [Polyplosphaeria fusca]|uniref:FAD binding domain protein n=1 Tax=Polyplosphaeria fusca TaxID=682080 RepID=A0A9P4QRF0_9PLEO|nr:FAD binding domain protein [Polyplosphaeria fusca]